MAYSSIEQETRDLDIFFKDSSKLIHIATAGGQIPNQLADNDKQNEEFASEISNFEETFEVEVNPNLAEFINIPDNGLERYLRDFILMASRGFYTYDKTKLGSFDDPFFHLVARPKKKENQSLIAKTENLLNIETVLPTDFVSFDLFALIDKK